jgi:hypothetical protein
VVSSEYGASLVYLDVGRPSFARAAELPFAAPGQFFGAPTQLVVIDLNGDSKPDIVQAVGDEGEASLIFRNRHGE